MARKQRWSMQPKAFTNRCIGCIYLVGYSRECSCTFKGYDEHLDLAGCIPFFMESLLVVIEDLVCLFILLEGGGGCTCEKKL